MIFLVQDNKLSLFNISKNTADGFLVFNTFTQGLMLLDDKHYAMLQDVNASGEILEKFLKYGFIVPQTTDEIKLLKFLNLKTRFDNTRMNLTIATTNNCNFRCTYCYQPHQVKYLSNDVEFAILNLINKKIEEGLKYLNIHWFGGEPLLNSSLIFRMENKLKDIKSLNYTSSITTNGSLITSDMIKSLKGTNVQLFQITVDGNESVHNRTRVLENGAGTFSNIMKNIKLLLSENIPVVIRYNINKLNEDIRPFLEYLISENLNKKLQLHFNEAKKFDICYTDENMFYNSTEEYSKVLLRVYKTLLMNGFSVPRYLANSINCEFDCINTFLVDTDGKLFQCSACAQDENFHIGNLCASGEIKYNNVPYVRKMLRNPFENLECIHCKVLPMCLGGCNFLEVKGKNKCIPEKYIIQDLIELYYEHKAGKI